MEHRVGKSHIFENPAHERMPDMCNPKIILGEKKEITLSLSGFVGFGVPLVVEKKIAIFQI